MEGNQPLPDNRFLISDHVVKKRGTPVHPRHTWLTRYRCSLPGLAGFAGPRCTEPEVPRLCSRRTSDCHINAITARRKESPSLRNLWNDRSNNLKCANSTSAFTTSTLHKTQRISTNIQGRKSGNKAPALQEEEGRRKPFRGLSAPTRILAGDDGVLLLGGKQSARNPEKRPGVIRLEVREPTNTAARLIAGAGPPVAAMKSLQTLAL